MRSSVAVTGIEAGNDPLAAAGLLPALVELLNGALVDDVLLPAVLLVEHAANAIDATTAAAPVIPALPVTELDFFKNNVVLP